MCQRTIIKCTRCKRPRTPILDEPCPTHAAAAARNAIKPKDAYPNGPPAWRLELSGVCLACQGPKLLAYDFGQPPTHTHVRMVCPECRRERGSEFFEVVTCGRRVNKGVALVLNAGERRTELAR